MSPGRQKTKNLRPLTPQEVAASDHIKERLAAIRGSATQEKVAAEVGVSQGQIWQWANRRLPVRATRAVALAKALGTTPAQVSAEYSSVMPDAVRELPAGYLPQQAGDLDQGQQAILEIYSALSPEHQATWRQVGSALAQQAQPMKTKEGGK